MSDVRRAMLLPLLLLIMMMKVGLRCGGSHLQFSRIKEAGVRVGRSVGLSAERLSSAPTGSAVSRRWFFSPPCVCLCSTVTHPWRRARVAVLPPLPRGLLLVFRHPSRSFSTASKSSAFYTRRRRMQMTRFPANHAAAPANNLAPEFEA